MTPSYAAGILTPVVVKRRALSKCAEDLSQKEANKKGSSYVIIVWGVEGLIAPPPCPSDGIRGCWPARSPGRLTGLRPKIIPPGASRSRERESVSGSSCLRP